MPADAELSSDADAMLWVEAIRQAGADCRGKLAAVGRIAGQAD